MKITATEEHIKNGYRQNSYRCPINLACRKHFPTNTYLYVGRTELKVGLNGDEKIYHLSKSTQAFIKRFDEGLPVEPSSFIIKEKTK